VDFGTKIPNISRFRVNFFNQKNGVAAVFRQIPSRVLSFEDFEKLEAPLPPVFKKFAMLHRGLVVVTGPTGSGKSTTLAAIVDYCNRNRKDHIITIEDPIEFVHESKNCLVTIVRSDSYQVLRSALRGALREDPDIILVGEMRDLETIELAITAAATGHLVFGTPAHAERGPDRGPYHRRFPGRPAEQGPPDAVRSVERRRGQTLFKRCDKKGRVAAFEVLVFNTAVANLVREGKTHQIQGMIQVGKKFGNQQLDDHIMETCPHEADHPGRRLRQGARQEEIPYLAGAPAGGHEAM